MIGRVNPTDREPWLVVIASTGTFAVRVLFRSIADALDFAWWMRANGWRVRAEPTRARCPHALRRTSEEEDLALALVIAHDRWTQVATGSPKGACDG